MLYIKNQISLCSILFNCRKNSGLWQGDRAYLHAMMAVQRFCAGRRILQRKIPGFLLDFS